MVVQAIISPQKGPVAMQAYPTAVAERKYATAVNHFESIRGFLDTEQARQMPHDEVETYLDREGRELLRLLLQEHLDDRKQAERRLRVVTGADGADRRQAVLAPVKLGSLFGEVDASRLLYQAPTRAGLAPLDALLNLPSGYYSHGVRRLIAWHVASNSYEEVRDETAAVTGKRVNKRQLEEIAISAACDFDAFYESQPVEGVACSSHLVLSFDGKGIVVRTQDLRDATRKAAQQAEHKLDKRLSKGEKRNRKRMTEVSAVYVIEPYVRTTEGIVGELRPLREGEAQRPKPLFKRVRASVVDNMSDVIDQAFGLADQLDPDKAKPRIVLVDGNKDQIRLVRKIVKERGVRVAILVDLIHVLEYLWKAAYCFCDDGTKEAEQWVTERLTRLLDGEDPSRIAAGIRRSATRRGLTARKPADDCAKYLINNRRWLNYPMALREGMPIATGVIEGACRYLVKDRMDRTGARWSLSGAEAVLRLRALRTNGDFDAYWQFHLDQERQRNHCQKYLDNTAPNPLAANDNHSRLRRIK